jgi:alpha-beta hydrolase superfamily lysophospholipase
MAEAQGFIEKKVLSSDGVHMLAGRVYVPEGRPKGIYQVVHGMSEYTVRYDFFMRRLRDEGYLVFGYDHLGHGYTVNDESEYGFIAHKDGWKRLVEDIGVFANAVRDEYGRDLPYYLMGHSMGSFIVRLAASNYIGTTNYSKPEKLIVMGTGGPNPAAGIGLFLTKITKFFKGEKAYSTFLEFLAFGSYNSHFKEENDRRSWLSKDRAIRNMYKNDTHCSFRFTVSALSDLMQLTKNCNSKKWFREFPEDIPVFLVSGSDDPVGDYGKGVIKVRDNLQAAGKNVKMKLYEDNRHEVLNDSAAPEVTADILDFIK